VRLIFVMEMDRQLIDASESPRVLIGAPIIIFVT
jgi:hypothetical protein